MKKTTAITVQILAFLVHAYNIWAPVIPEAKKPYVAAGIATLQLLITRRASDSNPDGTPACVPYQK